MNIIQKHRGPNDEGIVFKDKCVLGHRRLSILDLSKDGHQPFCSYDGRFYLVFNGEIYNYVELRHQLQKEGVVFSTKTDTEVLLSAYCTYGHNCLSRLNGMFAFAIFDSQKEELFLARDRMGIKPLYYTWIDDKFIFASEIKAFQAIHNYTPYANKQALFDYVVFNRTDIFDETFIRNLNRLPKGHYISLNSKGFNITQWWSPRDYLNSSTEQDEEKAIVKIDQLFSSSLNIRLRSDVPVGSSLSGGLDSSILVGCLFQKKYVNKDYRTFTVSFPGHRCDETRYVDDLQRKYAFENFRIIPTDEQAYDDLRNFVYTNDDPTTSSSFYAQYRLMKEVNAKGISVLLDGQGADELFAGYFYFYGFYLWELFKNKDVKSFLINTYYALRKKKQMSLWKPFVFQWIPDKLKKEIIYQGVSYIDKDFFDFHIEKSVVYKELLHVDNLNVSLVKHFQYKLEHLLRTEDRNSMAFSIEARVPYLDHRLVEYVLALPSSWKLKNGEMKSLQKRSLGDYTIESIMNRKDKIGFETPMEEWMSSPQWKNLTMRSEEKVRSMFPYLVSRKKNRAYVSGDAWKINQLAIWQDVFHITP